MTLLKFNLKITEISQIFQKSITILLILAMVWQFGFPRLTSLASEGPGDQSITPPETTQTLSPEEQMVQIISEVARQEGFANKELAIAIARAESRLNPLIRGEQDPRDRGLFQINSHYNPEVTDECAFDAWCASKWTIKELKAGHAWKWNASKYKWSKALTRS